MVAATARQRQLANLELLTSLRVDIYNDSLKLVVYEDY
jgi:hypothetical protein